MNNLNDLAHALNINNQNLLAFQNILNNITFHVGEYKLSAKQGDFYGWMLCDGRSLSRSNYAPLFDVVGTRFGSDDELTFKLPDYRGRVLGQPGQGTGLTSRTMGDAVGAETHTLTASQMPAHSHIGTTQAGGAHTHTITDPGHTHSQTTINDDFNSSGADPPGFAADSAGTRTWNNINSSTTGITVDSGGSHTHTFITSTEGGGLPHNIMQPTLFGTNVFIYGGNFL